MKNKIIFLIIFVFAFMLSYVAFGQETKFEDLDADEKQRLIVLQRDKAIYEAKDRGDYKCCIDPACTMCYMEANQWNNFKAGTCACDDFIAQDKEPCPQCKNGLGNNASCDTSNKIQSDKKNK